MLLFAQIGQCGRRIIGGAEIEAAIVQHAIIDIERAAGSAGRIDLRPAPADIGRGAAADIIDHDRDADARGTDADAGSTGDDLDRVGVGGLNQGIAGCADIGAAGDVGGDVGIQDAGRDRARDADAGCERNTERNRQDGRVGCGNDRDILGCDDFGAADLGRNVIANAVIDDREARRGAAGADRQRSGRPADAGIVGRLNLEVFRRNEGVGGRCRTVAHPRNHRIGNQVDGARGETGEAASGQGCAHRDAQNVDAIVGGNDDVAIGRRHIDVVGNLSHLRDADRIGDDGEAEAVLAALDHAGDADDRCPDGRIRGLHGAAAEIDLRGSDNPAGVRRTHDRGVERSVAIAAGRYRHVAMRGADRGVGDQIIGNMLRRSAEDR